MATGTTSAAVKTGGSNPTYVRATHTETWDGTAWSTSATLNLARFQAGSAGTAPTAIIFGGGGQPSTPTSGIRTETEEFSDVTSAAEASDIAFD